jgi:hypothetical protein
VQAHQRFHYEHGRAADGQGHAEKDGKPPLSGVRRVRTATTHQSELRKTRAMKIPRPEATLASSARRRQSWAGDVLG